MAKQITKEDLLKKNGELEAEVKSFEARDLAVRTNISEFIGSFQLSTRAWENKSEVKILNWSAIYFHIGKIMADRARNDNLTEIWERIEATDGLIKNFIKNNESL